MQVQVLGTVNILAWGLVPRHDEVTDGAIMVFGSRADGDVKFYVSSKTNWAQLQLRCDSGWDTYECAITDDEREALAKNYYRGC